MIIWCKYQIITIDYHFYNKQTDFNVIRIIENYHLLLTLDFRKSNFDRIIMEKMFLSN